MKALTDRQREVFDFVVSRETQPTFKEIGGHFGVSPYGARCHIIALIAKGFLLPGEPTRARASYAIPQKYRQARKIVPLYRGTVS